MLKIIEKLFLKKRYVLTLTASKELIPYDVSGYKIDILNKQSALKSDSDFLNKNKGFIIRFGEQEWTLYAVKDALNNKLAGYYFSVAGRFIHDNFFIDFNKALLCNAFIYPKHRKKGLYKNLIRTAHKHLYQKGFKEIFTIVEKNNKPSLHANLSAGLEIFSVNYLIKFFGINVLSLYYKNSKLILMLTGRIFLNKIIYHSPKLTKSISE